VQATNPRPRFDVVADGQGTCSHVGAALLGELSDRLGLTTELGRRANRGVRAGAHDRGQVLRDLVVMLADGGDCVSDLASLRDQPELFGAVCSTPTAWRVLAEELPADPRGIAGLWSALARVRERAWGLGAAPAGPLLLLDLDATLVEAHSDKQGAAPTYKQGFGFHPLGCWLDRGDGTGEALAIILRPGNAGSNTAADHVKVLAMALLALPKPARGRAILVRADSAGATHAFVNDLVRRNLEFSIGFDCDQRVQQAILDLPEQAWQPALDPDGRPRRGAWVAELATLDLASSGWPEGTRAVCRRERPHPGARHKMGFTDAAGHRFQVFITNQPDPDPAILEARHRPHAHVEDRIRGAKATGLRNLPLWGFAANANDAWLTLVCVAQTLVCWAQALLLSGDCRLAEPKTLRFRLWHVAGRIVRHARRLIVRVDRAWPWATDLVAAFARLRALPARC
jgi:Transposase DDE domain group 1